MFNQTELIKVYQSAPEVLQRIVIRVSVDLNNLDEILFRESERGSYWIVAGEQNIYCLFPRWRLKVNPHEYLTTHRLFDCQNYTPDGDKTFYLEKPALVSISPSPHLREWKLENRGMLIFNQDLKVEESAAEDTTSLKQELREFKEKCDNLEKQLEQMRQHQQKTDNKPEKAREVSIYREYLANFRTEYREYLANFRTELINEIKSLQIELKEEIKQMLEEASSSTTITPSAPSPIPQAPKIESQENQTLLKLNNQLNRLFSHDSKSSQQLPPLSEEEQQLIYYYDNDPTTLAAHAIIVSETGFSIAARRINPDHQVIFGRGKDSSLFSVLLGSGGKQYYLVPKLRELRTGINKRNLDSLEAVFYCSNYQDDVPQNLKLIKPAKVKPIRGLEQWQLEEKGFLEFIAIN